MNPYVEISLSRLKDNYINIKKSCPGVSFIFPVKCCSSEKILDVVCKYADGFDVSNMVEYNLVSHYDKDKIISASGPMSFELLDVENVLVATNSLNMWREDAGLRVNFNDDSNFEKSHFGIEMGKITDHIAKCVKYIHFHNSDFRNEYKCRCIYKKVEEIIKAFPNLEVLNIGGHLGEMTVSDATLFINTIRKIVPSDIKLVSEPGDFIISSCGVLFCQVVDVICEDERQKVFVNLSKVAQQRWTHPELTQYNKNTDSTMMETVFLGVSCCEGDVLYEGKCSKLAIGDILRFDNISTYSYEWNQRFNGLDRIEFRFI